MKCRHSILPYDNKQAIVSAVGLLNLLTLLKFTKNAFGSASSMQCNPLAPECQFFQIQTSFVQFSYQPGIYIP